jgi:hypothetical protein
MNTRYYQPIQIWTRLDSTSMACYNIFQRISDNHYAVQSKDIYRLNSTNSLVREFNEQRIVFFVEVDIEERETFFENIEIAIEVFEKSFNEDM